VLKFRVQKGDEEASDNVGPLNQTLATRLELALALADDDKEPVGIIRGASEVAALIANANHRDEEKGHPPLFGPKYPLAWGDALVKPDAFVYGGAKLSPDLRFMLIQLSIFSKEPKSTVRGDPFLVACDPGLLVEAGESFLVQGAFGKEPDALTPAKVIKAAADVRNESGGPSPLINPGAPVKFEMHYDGKVVPVEYQDGHFRVPEPKEGQKVSFVVRRQTGTTERLGVVLKVNGASSLFGERSPDAQCRKWVLEPGTDTLTIDHFQTSNKEDPGEITVQALAKADDKTIRYGPETGTISLVVFREARGKDEAPRGEGAADQAALARAAYPADKVADLAGLKERLRKDAAPESAGRALAAPAKAGDAPQETDFRADPTPGMADTVPCYKH
jgi:hypothetical protein